MGVSRVQHTVHHGFHLGSGGPINTPAGYQVSGMGFSGARGNGALLALPAGDSRGVSVALTHAHGSRKGTRVVPVRDPKSPERRACIRSSSRIASAATSSGRSRWDGRRRGWSRCRFVRSGRHASSAAAQAGAAAITVPVPPDARPPRGRRRHLDVAGRSHVG
jgi:hypothetical protein